MQSSPVYQKWSSTETEVLQPVYISWLHLLLLFLSLSLNLTQEPGTGVTPPVEQQAAAAGTGQKPPCAEQNLLDLPRLWPFLV